MKKAELEIGKKYVDKTLLMALGVLTDYFDFKEEDIVKFAESFAHVSDFLDKDYLKLKHIAEVIEMNTGMKFTLY